MRCESLNLDHYLQFHPSGFFPVSAGSVISFEKLKMVCIKNGARMAAPETVSELIQAKMVLAAGGTNLQMSTTAMVAFQLDTKYSDYINVYTYARVPYA